MQELLDRHAIGDVLVRYCRGVDRADADLILSCFHPDALDDHGRTKGTPAEFVTDVLGRMHDWRFVQHRISNSSFDIRGATAYTETYTSMVGARADGMLVHGVGRYIDQFERREGSWRIARRRVLTEWVSTGAGVEIADFVRGSRDRRDPSYDR